MATPRSPITPAQAVKAYRKHGMLTKAAEALGCSPTLVRSRLAKAGEPQRPRSTVLKESALTRRYGSRLPLDTADQRLYYDKLRRSGWSRDAAIAEALR